MRRIVLLDLNSTLAEKHGLNTANWTYDVSKDVYSKELVHALEGLNAEIILLTARPKKYESETLAKIAADTDLTIHTAAFKPDNLKAPVHVYKRDYLKTLLESGVTMEEIIAVESNANTHRTYKEVGLTNVWTREVFLKLCKNGRIFF